MTAPAEPNSDAESSDIKRANELIDSNYASRKRLKKEDESKTQSTTNEESGANSYSDKGIFALEADAAEDKGSRRTMEDAWVVLLDATLDFPGNSRCAHFAIYDGHGGRLAAEYAQKHLHKNVLSAGLPQLDVKCAKKAILNGFRKTDEALLQESAAGGWQDGATAVCMWVLGQTGWQWGKLEAAPYEVRPQLDVSKKWVSSMGQGKSGSIFSDMVFIANIGDAKAVVSRSSALEGSQSGSDSSNSLKAIVLTREHKAIYPQERARIQKAGGSVSSNGRLQGRLEVSRAFGDIQFKKVGVVATPDVHSFDLTERDHFVILGCDGLWGVFGPSDAVDFVHKLLKAGLSVQAVCRRLVREAVRERLCKDNCTAIVVVLKQQQ
ncbi:hypothetical protein OROMI_033850 [Orobanche minor]